MLEHILLVEPAHTELLYPFSLMHCAWELRCGALRLVDAMSHIFPAVPLLFHGRKHHLASFLARTQRTNIFPDTLSNTLVLHGNVLPTSGYATAIRTALTTTQSPVVFTVDGVRIGAFFPSVPATITPSDLADFPDTLLHGATEVELPTQRLVYVWDALNHNAAAIAEQAQLFPSTPPHTAPGAVLINDEHIIVGNNVHIGACSVLDASEGPIILGANVRIMPHSTVLGPCYLGDNTLIKVGAKIYGETSIGEWSKIGGEVENSIVHAFSNKQHDGFLGHSYLGEWVNLGADTNTSDLKNNYGSIRVQLGTEERNSGRMFLGLLCGDHTKSGINTMFNTGTVTGISANIIGGNFPPKFIPSFSWGGTIGAPRFEIEKAIELARTVMARRKRLLLPEEEFLLRAEFAR